MFLRRAPGAPVSVAVLPFNVLSGAQEIGFLGIGVPDTIISRSRTGSGFASARCARKGARRSQAGRPRARVEYVLTGTIQKAGDQIRITPQLMRVEDGVAIWTRPYTLSSTNLFTVQDEIARGVMEALQVQVTSEERGRAWRSTRRIRKRMRYMCAAVLELQGNARASTAAAVKSFEAALIGCDVRARACRARDGERQDAAVLRRGARDLQLVRGARTRRRRKR